MANTPWFVESDYLASKLEQLKELNEARYGEWTEDDVLEAIEGAGLTPLQHFEQFSGVEGTSPNEFFNVEQYLSNKAAQLNAAGEGGRSNWVPAEVAAAFAAAGLNAWSHFQQHGWKEGLNPSNAFDIDAYFADKLAQLQEAGEDYETVDQVKEAFAEAGLDPISHFYAYGEEEGLEPKPAKFLNELTAAMEAYTDAQDAKADFLDAAAESDLIDESDFEGEDLEAYIEAEEGLISWAKEQLGEQFEDVSDDAIEPTIAAVRADLAAKLTAATTQVNATKGLKAAIDSAIVANEQLSDAEKAQETAENAAEAELAKVEVLASNEDFDFDVESEDAVLVITEADSDRVLTISIDGRRLKVEDEDGLAADVEGFAELLAKIEAAFTAGLAVDAAEGRLDALLESVNTKEGADTLTREDGELVAAADSSTAGYLSAAKAVTDFEKAVANYEAAIQMQSDLEGLEEAVSDAAAAIADLGYFLNDTTVGTEENDVFVFDVNADNDPVAESITLFGELGTDVFFIGTEYSLGADVENGDNSVLEVFLTQEGANTVVTIEQSAFGSNAAEPEVWEVTLVGVDAESVTFADGYVQFA